MPANPRLPPAAESERAGAHNAVLASAIDACRRRLTHAALLRGLLYVLAGAALFPLLAVIADHTVPGGLPRPLIFGVGISWGLVTLVVALGLSLRTLLRRLSTLFVARDVERSCGIAHNALINTVLLRETPTAAYAHDAAVRQAASVLAASDPPSQGIGASLRTSALALLAAGGLWLFYAAITPKPILPSLARFCGADCAAPTATRLELVHPRPDEPVYIGEPLQVELEVRGRPVADVWLELLDPADPNRPPLLRSALQRSEGSEGHERRRVLLAAHEVAGDLHYRCSAGDAVLAGVITARPQPALADLQIELAPPAHIGEPVRRATGLDLEVWAGTRATFAARANTEVLDPVFVFRGESETRTRMSVSPTRPHDAALSLSLTESGDYWIEFFDRWGRPCADPAVHRVVARGDAAPWIEITAPSAEQTPGDLVDVTYVPWLRAVASDDVQLEAVSLVHEQDGTVSRVDLPTTDASGRGRTVEVEVATSELSLEVDETLRIWFEVRDNHTLFDGTAAPQTSRSPVLTLIRTPEVQLAEVAQGELQSGDEADGVGLADSAGRLERIVTRRGTGDDEGGVPTGAGGAVGEAAGADEGAGQAAGGTYQRSSGTGGEDGSSEDAASEPAVLDPDGVTVFESDSAASDQAELEQEGEASSERGEAAEQFKRELRRFSEQHADEVRELREQMAAKRDTEQPAPGQGAAGESPQTSPLDQQAQSPPDSDNQPRSSDLTDSPPADTTPADAGQDGEKPPASQPAESDPAEAGQSDAPAATPESPSEHAAQQPQADEQSAPTETPPQPQAEPVSGQDSQGQGEPVGQQQAPGDEPASSQSQGVRGDQSAGEPADDGAPAGEPGTERSETGKRGGTDGQSGTDELSPAGPGERVIEMPRPGPSPPEPVKPSSAVGGELGEPGDRSAGRDERADVTDTLGLLARGEGVLERNLAALAWPLEQQRMFLRDFERLQEVARRAGALSQLRVWRMQGAVGSPDLLLGAGLAGDVSAEVGAGQVVRDGLEQIAPPREQRVPPELQAILDAYYRSLAERRAQQREQAPSPSPSP